ncbi:tryptophan synthase beta subunit-like PLP-dependent enzyme [Phlyctochytrium arcticum]|nr:tryptophan synthase beta subunit-like PLP-dependent enzyme [Phlyctochytrium arcticum]
MKYRSTRGKSSNLSFEEAVFEGLAVDGGLYIPHSIPTLSLQEIQKWADLSYPKLAAKVFRLFVGEEEIPDADLDDILERSFGTFATPEVTPLNKLPNVSGTSGGNLDNVYVLELFHGPTFAFKDVALQVLGNLFEYFLERRNRSAAKAYGITVLGATSGDTGGAAIYGLRGKKNVDVFILHPKGRISPVQEQQMTSVLDENVHNVAIEGTFDDCQDTVKQLFGDEAFRRRFHLAAINSINWARILAQITYYFYSYFSLLRRIGTPAGAASYAALTKIRFSVPTGNFGDILAGYYAIRMGLPIDKLVAATNENDILHRFFETGRYEKKKSEESEGVIEPVRQTLSPAMDILVSSNFERLLWYLCRGDERGSPNPELETEERAQLASNTLRQWMNELRESGGFSVPSELLSRARQIFSSFCTTDVQTMDAINRYYHNQFSATVVDDAADRTNAYVLDPHTAVGVVAAEHFAKNDTSSGVFYTICLSTASPGKFPEAVLKAINDNPSSLALQRGFTPIKYEDFAPKELVDLEGKPRRCLDITTGGDKAMAAVGVRQTIEQEVGTRFLANL